MGAPLRVISVTLRPLAPTFMEAGGGRAGHGFLYQLLETHDPLLSQAVHDAKGPKPFTVSPFRGRVERKHEGALYSPRQSYRLRFTALAEPVATGLLESLRALQQQGDPVLLAGGQWQLLDLSTGEDGDEGRGATTFEALWDNAGHATQWTLRWLSPTALRQGKRHLLFPLPGPVFAGLIDKWRAFAPIPLPVGLFEFVQEKVVAEAHSLRTERVRFNQRFQIHGFRGWCRFRALNKEREYLRAVRALARFALFAGTGHKTTMGMGQTRPEL